MRTARRGPRRLALLLVPATFLALFFVLPVGTIVATGIAPEGRLEAGPLVRTLTDPWVRSVAWFTLWQAVASTVCTLAVGLPAAWVFARMAFRGRTLLRSLIMIPFVLPTVVVGSAFLALLGPRSPINALLGPLVGADAPVLDLRRTVTAILLAHVFFNYAVVVRTVGALWALLDPRLEDSARLLGASAWRAFREVTLPLLRPAIVAAATIVFLFTFTSFGVILILGGAHRATLEVEIHRVTTQLLDLPTAAALALIQLVAVLVTLTVYGRSQRQRAGEPPLAAAATTSRAPRSTAERWLLRGNLVVMVGLLATPLLVLLERSLVTDAGYRFDHYLALFTAERTTVLAVPAAEAIRNSLLFGALATVVALVVGGLAATAVAGGTGRLPGWVDRALMVPLGTSAVTLGFGFLLVFGRPPLALLSSPWLVPVAQALVATPFVVRTLVPVLRAIDQRLRDAAAVLGAGPLRVWREVDLPIVGRALFVAAGFSFAIAVGEFGATVFIARANLPTMPVAIFRLLGRPGLANFGQAMAMSTVLMMVTASALLAIDRLRLGQVGRF